MSNLPLFTLFMAAACSAGLYIILKYFERWKIDNLQGLTINYITASSFAFLITRDQNAGIIREQAPLLLGPAAAIGLLFILVFLITAKTAQESGLAIVSIASKMSMVIPVFAGVFLYGDHLTVIRVCGIAVALLAVYLTSVKTEKGSHTKSRLALLLPLILFIGSGLVDTSIKASQHYFINSSNQNLYFCFLFGTAGVFGLCAVIFQYLKFGKVMPLRTVFAGLLLGTVNYYSLVFLVNALAAPGAESAIVFAIVNMLVVVLSAASGIVIFKEHPGKANITGIALALLAIVILSF